MLLTGDLERAAKTGWWNRRDPLRKIPSAAPSSMPGTWRVNATGEALLDLAQPELVLISCGKNNRYGHPAPETLKRLEERGIRWYSTAEVGAIQVHVGKKK